MDKVTVVVAIDFDKAKEMMKVGEITHYDNLSSIPKLFKEKIREFMSDNVGYETGPIFCVARLNGIPVNLSEKSDGIQLEDVLTIGPGDLLLQFLIKTDKVVSIPMDMMFELVRQAKEFGEDNDIVLDMLYDSLTLGVNDESDNVFCFLSKLAKSDYVSYRIIDEQWQRSDERQFDEREIIQILKLSQF